MCIYIYTLFAVYSMSVCVYIYMSGIYTVQFYSIVYSIHYTMFIM